MVANESRRGGISGGHFVHLTKCHENAFRTIKDIFDVISRNSHHHKSLYDVH